MNIVLFISCLYGGGAERTTCNLATYLAEKGHHIEILAMAETEKAYKLSEKVAVKLLLSRRERRGRVFNAILRLFRFWQYLIKHKETDIYIVMLPKTSLMLLAFHWMTKAKVIVAERSYPGLYSSMDARLLKFYAHKANGFVFQTNDIYKWYKDDIKNIKIRVIPNAINKEFITDEVGEEKENIVIAVGRLSKEKNFGMLIEAFQKICKKFSEYRLIIYGEGPERENLERQISRLKLEKRVLLPGNTIDIVNKYKKAKVFALSSDFEGMPNALMEAMSVGLPCISTDCLGGGPNYLVSNGKNGILVPANNSAMFAEALDKVLSSEEFAEKLGREAMKIRDYLSVEQIYSQWETFIKEVVSD